MTDQQIRDMQNCALKSTAYLVPTWIPKIRIFLV